MVYIGPLIQKENCSFYFRNLPQNIYFLDLVTVNICLKIHIEKEEVSQY